MAAIIAALVPALVGIARLFLDVFNPVRTETARAINDPLAPTADRLARPDRLRNFSRTGGPLP